MGSYLRLRMLSPVQRSLHALGSQVAPRHLFAFALLSAVGMPVAWHTASGLGPGWPLWSCGVLFVTPAIILIALFVLWRLPRPEWRAARWVPFVVAVLANVWFWWTLLSSGPFRRPFPLIPPFFWIWRLDWLEGALLVAGLGVGLIVGVWLAIPATLRRGVPQGVLRKRIVGSGLVVQAITLATYCLHVAPESVWLWTRQPVYYFAAVTNAALVVLTVGTALLSLSGRRCKLTPVVGAILVSFGVMLVLTFTVGASSVESHARQVLAAELNRTTLPRPVTWLPEHPGPRELEVWRKEGPPVPYAYAYAKAIGPCLVYLSQGAMPATMGGRGTEEIHVWVLGLRFRIATSSRWYS